MSDIKCPTIPDAELVRALVRRVSPSSINPQRFRVATREEQDALYRTASTRKVAVSAKREAMFTTDDLGYQKLGSIPAWALSACAGCGALRQREINTPEMLKRPGYKVRTCKKCSSTRFVSFSEEMRPWFIEDLTGYGNHRFTCTSCGVPYGKWSIFGCGCTAVRNYGLVKEQKKTIGAVYTRRHQPLQLCRLCCYGMYTAEKKGEVFTPPKHDVQRDAPKNPAVRRPVLTPRVVVTEVLRNDAADAEHLQRAFHQLEEELFHHRNMRRR